MYCKFWRTLWKFLFFFATHLLCEVLCLQRAYLNTTLTMTACHPRSYCKETNLSPRVFIEHHYATITIISLMCNVYHKTLNSWIKLLYLLWTLCQKFTGHLKHCSNPYLSNINCKRWNTSRLFNSMTTFMLMYHCGYTAWNFACSHI